MRCGSQARLQFGAVWEGFSEERTSTLRPEGRLGVGQVRWEEGAGWGGCSGSCWSSIREGLVVTQDVARRKFSDSAQWVEGRQVRAPCRVVSSREEGWNFS